MGAFFLIFVVQCAYGSYRMSLDFDMFLSNKPVEKTGEVEPYDFVFDIKSISDLTNGNGWALEVRNWTQGADLLKNEFQGSIASVMGMYNRGKTWFFNRLAGTNLQASMTAHTLGLSFKEAKDFFGGGQSRVLLLDTAGTMAPIEDLNGGVDRMEVETFLSEVILDMSVNVIFVVNDLTWPEQQSIETVLKVRRAKKKAQSFGVGVDDVLLVVHNWRYQNYDQMEKQFEDLVKVTYPVGERVVLDDSVGAFYWSSQVEKVDAGSNSSQSYVVEHFFLCSETMGDTDNNKLWNEAVFDRVRRTITNVPPVIASRKRKVMEEVLSHLNLRLRNYFVLRDENKAVKGDLLELRVEDDVPKLVLRDSNMIQRKRDFRVPLCIPQPQREAEFEPPYILFLSEKDVVLRIEVPGLHSLKDLNITKRQGQLDIRGYKGRPEDESVVEFLNPDRRVVGGSWQVKVKLGELDSLLMERDLWIHPGRPDSITLHAGVVEMKFGFHSEASDTTYFSDEMELHSLQNQMIHKELRIRELEELLEREQNDAKKINERLKLRGGDLEDKLLSLMNSHKELKKKKQVLEDDCDLLKERLNRTIEVATLFKSACMHSSEEKRSFGNCQCCVDLVKDHPHAKDEL